LAIDDRAVGQTLDAAFDEDMPLAQVAQNVLEFCKSQYDRDFSVTRQGHSVGLRADGHLLRDTDDSTIGVVMYIRDITERTLIEDQMRRMERFMGLGTLAAGLHHEIKNPLSALSLHVQLLEESLEGNQDYDVGEHLGVLKTEITRINGVLESFRNFASLATLKRSHTDLSQLVKQTAELIRPKSEQQHVELKLNLPSQPPPLISADSARLEQVLLNLVLNSLDSMRQGGTLGLSLHQDNGTIKIDVADTGPGIPENVQGRIFDPYFTTKTDGSGMGLALCDKVIQQHNGQIAFQTSSKGTVFQISLPVDSS
jgi:signal transduction histidine kinase